MAKSSTAVKEVIVYKSIATSIWSNLALEDWIFHHVDLSHRRILLVWRNLPTVVIGRHQNPWLETNIPLIREKGVALGRRRSGGGTVYQDLGNLNLTVFSHQSDYNRPRSLKLVCDALNEGWGTKLHVNKRDDILYNNHWKVSGSSAKLAKNSAYHHFTLLLNANTDNLHTFLKPHPKLLPSRSIATPSERSEVINLCTFHPRMSHDAVAAAVGDRFYQVHQVNKEDRKVIEVDPSSEKTFPGINNFRRDLEKWTWVYGKTPKFSLSSTESFSFGDVEFTVSLASGTVQESSLQLLRPRGTSSEAPSQRQLEEICSSIKGKRFWREDIAAASQTLPSEEDGDMRAIRNWITQLT